ncbi:MAG: neutral zinc metallopeptidase [Bryobacteraceae bacterium]|jgi:predicted metalloprotease
MEWTPSGTSGDIEDRRNDSGGGPGFGGFHLGIGGAIIIGLLSLVFHRNLFQLFSGQAGSAPVARSRPNADGSDPERPEVQFVSFVLDDAQKNWDRMLPDQEHIPYRHAKLVLIATRILRLAGWRRRRSGRFTVRATRKFIWIWDFSMS